MTTDEFENPDSSPVPPYDRTWRHPAEVADSARTTHLTNAPPLGRRLTAITVLASAVSSLVVLAIAVPRGVQEYGRDEPDSTSTTITAPVKGNAIGPLAILRGSRGSTSALSLGDGLWLVATESFDASAVLSKASFSVVRQDRLAGVSIIRLINGASAPALDFSHLKSSLTSDQLSKYTIVDAFRQHEVAPEPSLTSRSKSGVHPVNMTSTIKGIALALDRRNRIVGVLVRHDHAQWSLTRDALLALATP